LLLLLLLRGWRGVGCELEEVDEEGGGAVDPFDGGVALSPVSCPEKAALRDIVRSVVGRCSGGEETFSLIFCCHSKFQSRVDRRGQVFRLTRLGTPQGRLVAEGGNERRSFRKPPETALVGKSPSRCGNFIFIRIMYYCFSPVAL